MTEKAKKTPAGKAKKAADTKKTPEKTPEKKASPAKAKPAAASTPSTTAGVPEELTGVEREAFYLSEAAIMLDRARANGRDEKALAEALLNNIEVWTAVRASVGKWGHGQSEEVKGNLLRLADFVTGTIMANRTSIVDSTLDSLININLQIAEGLLEGLANQRIRERAYHIWEEEGRPHGRDDENWYRAEQEVLVLETFKRG